MDKGLVEHQHQILLALNLQTKVDFIEIFSRPSVLVAYCIKLILFFSIDQGKECPKFTVYHKPVGLHLLLPLHLPVKGDHQAPHGVPHHLNCKICPCLLCQSSLTVEHFGLGKTFIVSSKNLESLLRQNKNPACLSSHGGHRLQCDDR